MWAASEAEHPVSPQRDLKPEFVKTASDFLDSKSFLYISRETLRSGSSSQTAAQADRGKGAAGDQRQACNPSGQAREAGVDEGRRDSGNAHWKGRHPGWGDPRMPRPKVSYPTPNMRWERTLSTVEGLGGGEEQ